MSCGSAESLSTAQSESMMKRLVKLLGIKGFGPLVVISTVKLSTLETLATEESSSFMAEVGIIARSNEKTTSSALNSAPL